MKSNAPSALPMRGLATLPPVPWGLRDLFFAILITAAGLLVLNLAVLAINVAMQGALAADRNAVSFFLVGQELVVIGAAWLFSVARYRAGWERLGLRAFNVPMGCALSLGLLIASYGVRLCYGLFITALGVHVSTQAVLTRLETTGIGFVLTFVMVAVVGPIVEEIFFRGFLYAGLRARFGVVSAMVVSTVFFTALHLSLEQFVPILVLGLFLAFLYEHTGSLYPGMFLHVANNAISLLLFVILQATGQLPP